MVAASLRANRLIRALGLATATVPDLFESAGAAFAFDAGPVSAAVDAVMNSAHRVPA